MAVFKTLFAIRSHRLQVIHVSRDQAKAAKRAKLNEELDLLESKLGNLGASIKTTDDEMATLKQEIAKLDTSVADATAARKAEHSEFTATTAELQMVAARERQTRPERCGEAAQ